MPVHKKQYLSSAEQDAFNQLISLRKSIKNNFQATWNIPDNTPQIVHDALYAFIPTQAVTLPEPLHLLKTATALTHDYSIDHHDTLLQALYTRNGIFKDFTQYRHATISFPELINSQPYAATRESLNKVLYFAQTASDATTTALAQQALAYLQAHFAATDQLEAHCYLTLHHALCNALEGHGDQLVVTLPDLVAPPLYTTEQLDIHRALLATVCTALDLHRPELAWTNPNATQEAETWAQLVGDSHKLNKQGDTQKALDLLEDYFVKPYQLQNDIPADNSPPPNLPTGPNTNKQNNNTNEEPTLVQGAKLLTPALALKEYCEQAEEFFQECLIMYKDKVEKFYELTKIRIQSLDFQHVFKSIMIKDKKIVGGHSTKFENIIYEYITNPEADRCYEVFLALYKKTGDIRKIYKSIFPDNWEAQEITKLFFESLDTSKIIKEQVDSLLIELQAPNEQQYRFFISLTGNIRSYFPFFQPKV